MSFVTTSFCNLRFLMTMIMAMNTGITMVTTPTVATGIPTANWTFAVIE